VENVKRGWTRERPTARLSVQGAAVNPTINNQRAGEGEPMLLNKCTVALALLWACSALSAETPKSFDAAAA
jgi:hypothetical protein